MYIFNCSYFPPKLLWSSINEVRGGGSLGSIIGRVGGPALVFFLVLRESIWNTLAVSIVLKAFDNVGCLGCLPWWMVYPCGFHPGDCLPFIAGNREAELKPTTFSSLLLFRNFLFPLLLLKRYSALTAQCWDYSLIIKINK